jgi:hypothetical protein
MRCSWPNVCIWYHESDAKKPYCTLHEFYINYTNTEKIETCQNHKTLEEIMDNYKNNGC